MFESPVNLFCQTTAKPPALTATCAELAVPVVTVFTLNSAPCGVPEPAKRRPKMSPPLSHTTTNCPVPARPTAATVYRSDVVIELTRNSPPSGAPALLYRCPVTPSAVAPSQTTTKFPESSDATEGNGEPAGVVELI